MINTHDPSLILGCDIHSLERIIEPIVHAHGAELFAVELKTEQGQRILRVSIEKLGSTKMALSTREASVSLEMCSKIARDLNLALDVAGVIRYRYQLEVSTPGLERRLRNENDFVRFTGHKVKLKLHTPLQGQKVLVGRLVSFSERKILLEVQNQCYEIDFSDIVLAHLLFEGGALPPHSSTFKRKKVQQKGKVPNLSKGGRVVSQCSIGGKGSSKGAFLPSQPFGILKANPIQQKER